MNSICTPSEWNQPDLIEFTRKLFPTVKDPVWALTYTKQISTTGKPELAVVLNGHGVFLTRVVIEPFTGHCGIRSIAGPSVSHLPNGALRVKYEKLWIKTIEAFIKQCEYSAIVASDGPGHTHRQLQQAGWEIWNPGVNIRMGANHQLYVMMKYLNKDDHSWLNLSDSSLIKPKPNPIMEKEVAKVYAQSTRS